MFYLATWCSHYRLFRGNQSTTPTSPYIRSTPYATVKCSLTSKHYFLTFTTGCNNRRCILTSRAYEELICSFNDFKSMFALILSTLSSAGWLKNISELLNILKVISPEKYLACLIYCMIQIGAKKINSLCLTPISTMDVSWISKARFQNFFTAISILAFSYVFFRCSCKRKLQWIIKP